MEVVPGVSQQIIILPVEVLRGPKGVDPWPQSQDGESGPE